MLPVSALAVLPGKLRQAAANRRDIKLARKLERNPIERLARRLLLEHVLEMGDVNLAVVGKRCYDLSLDLAGFETVRNRGFAALRSQLLPASALGVAIDNRPHLPPATQRAHRTRSSTATAPPSPGRRRSVTKSHRAPLPISMSTLAATTPNPPCTVVRVNLQCHSLDVKNSFIPAASGCRS